jgi:predicted short-subunit dehydrogenase-like oxidoreductase (DUF2520 family)
VATHLAVHFQKAGHRVTCIYSRNAASACRLADLLDTEGTADTGEVPREADFYLLCVPDHAVLEVSGLFAGYEGVWLHCAGALPLEILSESHQRFGVLYPLQTFSRDRELSLQDVPFLIEGSSDKVIRTIGDLAGSVSSSVHRMDTSSRLSIHLAAVFASNFANHMVHVAQQILQARGIDPELMLPLLKETFDKLSMLKAADAQTGPARRGDVETMQRHIRMLNEYPEWKKLYTFISRDIRDAYSGKNEE